MDEKELAQIQGIFSREIQTHSICIGRSSEDKVQPKLITTTKKKKNKDYFRLSTAVAALILLHFGVAYRQISMFLYAKMGRGAEIPKFCNSRA